MNFVANIPYIKCWVKKEYLHDLNKGHGEFVECVYYQQLNQCKVEH